MQIAPVFPQNEMGEDPGAVRAFAQAAEDLGYDYLILYDHVLGPTRARAPAGQALTPTPTLSMSRWSRSAIWRQSPIGSGS